MALESLHDLFVDELKDLYSAESQLVKALPEMAEGASSQKLKTAFRDHLEQTRGHVTRLQDIFEGLKAKPGGKTCKAMRGLVEEGDEMLNEDAAAAVRDAGLIGAAQRVEHYEMAAYGTAIAHAKRLGEKKMVTLLEQTFDEEKKADAKLTQIAERDVNVEADA